MIHTEWTPICGVLYACMHVQYCVNRRNREDWVAQGKVGMENHLENLKEMVSGKEVPKFKWRWVFLGPTWWEFGTSRWRSVLVWMCFVRLVDSYVWSYSFVCIHSGHQACRWSPGRHGWVMSGKEFGSLSHQQRALLQGTAKLWSRVGFFFVLCFCMSSVLFIRFRN